MVHAAYYKNARDIKAAAFQSPLPGGSTGSGVATRSEDRPRGSRQGAGPLRRASGRLFTCASRAHLKLGVPGAGRRGSGSFLLGSLSALQPGPLGHRQATFHDHWGVPLPRPPPERAERSQSTFVPALVGCLCSSHFGERIPRSSNSPSVYYIP